MSDMYAFLQTMVPTFHKTLLLFLTSLSLSEKLPLNLSFSLVLPRLLTSFLPRVLFSPSCLSFSYCSAPQATFSSSNNHAHLPITACRIFLINVSLSGCFKKMSLRTHSLIHVLLKLPKSGKCVVQNTPYL